MIPKEKAEVRLNCLYAAINITGVNSTSMKGKRPRPTTEEVLNEAKKIWGWVSKKGDDR